MSESLKNKTIANISYSAAGKVISFIFQAVTNIILSREIGASDYGIVGFAMIFVNFLKSFGDLGINIAAMQRKELDDRALNIAFTLKFVLGIIVYLVAFIAAAFAPKFFNNPSIVIVIRLLAINILLYSFSFMPGVVLARKLNFKYITISETILYIVSSILAATMALLGYKFWSIVIANVVSNLAFVVAMNCFSPNRMRFAFDISIAKEYLRYGSKIFFSGLLSFAVYNLDNFVIGAVAGDKQLGYYVIAFNWGSMICVIITGTVLNVLFNTLSSIQDETEKTVRAYKKIIEYVALLSVLFNVVLFCVSDEFLVYVLGKSTDKWIPSLIALKILCAYGIARSLLQAVSTYFAARGMAGIVLKANLLVAAIEIILVYPAILYGSIEFVAVVVLVAYLASAYIYINDLKLINMSARDLWKPIQPSIIALVTTLAFYYVVIDRVPSSFAMLFVKSTLLVSAYLLAYGVVTKFKLYRQVLSGL
jgi:lipopolysaccharide exporter